MLKRFLFAIAALALCSTGAFAQDIFLNFGGGAVSTEFIADGTSTTGEVNIYARNGFDFQAAEFSFTSGDTCLLYTSPSPRDQRGSRMPSSA